jgi:hypothetical protein
MNNRPAWYTDDHDNNWERVKGAFSRDWEQTKHDFGSKTARDLDQDAGDTIKQAAGSDDDSFDTREPAFRFGHAAQRQYQTQHATWNDDLDKNLRNDYGADYDRDKPYIRHAYEYRYGTTDRTQGDNDGLRNDAR